MVPATLERFEKKLDENISAVHSKLTDLEKKLPKSASHRPTSEVYDTFPVTSGVFGIVEIVSFLSILNTECSTARHEVTNGSVLEMKLDMLNRHSKTDDQPDIFTKGQRDFNYLVVGGDSK
jgi:hypothetical protein